eukprot:gene35654-46249_t
MVSPVTRYSAGRLYHQQLARQMADLMLTKGRLTALGGMITLTDLYCVFNRARGTEAAELTGQLNLGVSLKVFPSSGVKVLQLDSYRDEQVVSQRIMDIFRTRRTDGELGQVGIYATDVSEELNLSLVIAKEQLLIAENLELICRDESVFGKVLQMEMTLTLSHVMSDNNRLDKFEQCMLPNKRSTLLIDIEQIVFPKQGEEMLPTWSIVNAVAILCDKGSSVVDLKLCCRDPHSYKII